MAPEHQQILQAFDRAVAVRDPDALQAARLKLEALPPGFGEKRAPRSQRDVKLHLLVLAFLKVDAAPDKTFDWSDPPLISVRGYDLTDPSQRAEHARRTEEERKKSKRFWTENRIRAERVGALNNIAEFAQRFQQTPADKATLKQVLDLYLKDPGLRSEVDKKIEHPPKRSP